MKFVQIIVRTGTSKKLIIAVGLVKLKKRPIKRATLRVTASEPGRNKKSARSYDQLRPILPAHKDACR